MPAVDPWPEAEARTAEVARTRRGRHRDSALASYRRARALELRTQGLSYDEIAREVGYTSRATAYDVIKQALESRETDSAEQLRALELARLEAVHAALWDDAVGGDVQAVLALLWVLDARCRLLGLYEPARRGQVPQDGWDNCSGPPTVVLHPDDCRWRGCSVHGAFRDESRRTRRAE